MVEQQPEDKPFDQRYYDLAWEHDQTTTRAYGYQGTHRNNPVAIALRNQAADLDRRMTDLAVDAILDAAPDQRGAVLDDILRVRRRSATHTAIRGIGFSDAGFTKTLLLEALNRATAPKREPQR